MLQKIKGFFKKPSPEAIEITKKYAIAVISVALAVTTIMLTVICSAHTTSVFDGKRTRTFLGFASNVGSMLATVGLSGRDYEVVDHNNYLFGSNVEIAYLVPLTVKIGNEVNTYSVREGKLETALKDAGLSVDEHDILSLSLDHHIDGATSLEIIDVEFVTETRTETIPFGNEILLSNKYDTNTSVTTAGKVGTKTVTTCIKYVNGVATEVVSTDEKITEYAIDSTTIYGTTTPQYAVRRGESANSVPCISKLSAPDDLLLDENGKPIKYLSKTTLRATAYTHTGNKMATGKYPTPGYVAVDPKEIPYGTKMYIVSADGKYVYGYAIAADTGGFIHDTRADMDLFLDSEQQCVQFGRRDIIVYFVG